ncbi:hypothetical protein [Spirilliplanes yamanashiensis]|uniref:Uncharacterized protein n=1 Tax=Spirilliplanes yamanashiensis TaxID=42233 RepID=A0A8J3YBI8_9ACTN|nr:hypothetical protein [Spirilliplanes yamanashiensis]MDP9818045.1 anti-sigma-K factor RskA [Spirilliplanes yamanashiensis]GIJ04854.1 hypothetical protein Sya03_42060 [Spirilliplanes yamanashiensis]
MADEARLRRQLVARIENRRADIDRFLARARPRRNVLVNVSIVSSALAAVFTAGPAVGGAQFAGNAARQLNLSGPPAVWRPLCVAAFVVALVAAVAANLSRSHDLAARVTAAEACNAELESLLTLLKFRHLPLDEAAGLYQQYVAMIPFVDDRDPAAQPATR